MRCSRGRRFRSCDACLFPGLLLTVVTSITLVGCERRTPETSSTDHTASTNSMPATRSESREAAAPRPKPVRYRRSFVAGPRRLAVLRDSLESAGFHEVLKVNRLDEAHIRRGDSLIIPIREPQTPSENEGSPITPAASTGTQIRPGAIQVDSLACSPFPPELENARSLPKLLLVSLRVQAFAAYEQGTLVRWGPTCTGRRDTPTPPGLYHTNWKARERRSSVNSEWLLKWYVNLDNLLGVSLHQYDLPGRPASHSCVRLLEEDARWLYHWSVQWKLAPEGVDVAQEGTPVVIFGTYAYGKRAPWKRLPEEPGATSIQGSELEDAVSVALPKP